MAKETEEVEAHDVVIGLSVGNAAFAGELCGREIARILRGLALFFEDVAEGAGGEFKVRDVNGNPVGVCLYDVSPASRGSSE